ncbi:hypothetical protein WEI85_35255 [Actinomycetes bacterium KLBMP 9797]
MRVVMAAYGSSWVCVFGGWAGSSVSARTAPVASGSAPSGADVWIVADDPVTFVDPHRFRLIDADPLDSGVVVLRYRVGSRPFRFRG